MYGAGYLSKSKRDGAHRLSTLPQSTSTFSKLDCFTILPSLHFFYWQGLGVDISDVCIDSLHSLHFIIHSRHQVINTLVVAIDPIKNLETLNLSTDEKDQKASPGATWKKSKNSDKRFWFLEDVAVASEALELLDDTPKQGRLRRWNNNKAVYTARQSRTV